MAFGAEGTGLAQESATPLGEEPGAADASAAPAPALGAKASATAYRGPDEAEALLSTWLGTGLCERLSLPETVGGRSLFGVQFGGWGQTALAERTTIFLVGGLDGLSLAGSEAVAHCVDALLADPDRLPQDVTFVALPWANPDGLVRRLESACPTGRNDRALDDDGDGRRDEDAPDDLDGDGYVLEMLLEDAAGEWVRCEDGRFLRPARPGEAPRYKRVPEGQDDDGDGRYNEDGLGGVDLARNFPLAWAGPLVDPTAGSWPLSEPETRGLAELVMARRTACVLFFHGNHGGIVLPGTAAPVPTGEELGVPQEGTAFETLGALFENATEREVVSMPSSALGSPPRGARIGTANDPLAGVRPGAAIDWLHGALGVLAIEVAPWGPDLEASGRSAMDAQYALEPGSLPQDDALAELSRSDRQWVRWLDETRGGLGFVDWQPVDLGDGRQGLVGGWEPLTCTNPPTEALAAAIDPLDTFVLDVARALPRLELDLIEARRDGEACVLRVRLRNLGALPSGLPLASPAGVASSSAGVASSTGGAADRLERRSSSGIAEAASEETQGSVPRAGFGPLTVQLELPEGVRLLAGETSHVLEHVPGSGASEELAWLIVAPAGSVFRFQVRAPWLFPMEREVRL